MDLIFSAIPSFITGFPKKLHRLYEWESYNSFPSTEILCSFSLSQQGLEHLCHRERDRSPAKKKTAESCRMLILPLAFCLTSTVEMRFAEPAKTQAQLTARLICWMNIVSHSDRTRRAERAHTVSSRSIGTPWKWTIHDSIAPQRCFTWWMSSMFPLCAVVSSQVTEWQLSLYFQWR